MSTSFWSRIQRVVLCSSVLSAACGSGSPPPPVDAGGPCAVMASIDDRVFERTPDPLNRIAANVTFDTNGRVGQNATFGAVVAPAWQAEGAVAARVAISAIRSPNAEAGAPLFSAPTIAIQGLTAIEAGFSQVDAQTGVVRTTPPPGSAGGSLPPAENALAGAMFLGPACAGLRALRAGAPAELGLEARIALLESKVVKALAWLETSRVLITTSYAQSPARLLVYARALGTCSAFANRIEYAFPIQQLISTALLRQNPDGSFREGPSGTIDTGMQALALASGYDLVLWGSAAECGVLTSGMTSPLELAANWLAMQVLPSGRINTSGNAFTCTVPSQTFLGKSWQVNHREAMRAMLGIGSVARNMTIIEAALRIDTALQTNSALDNCQ